eukprot:TRINITY_DN14900_c0_g1_i1.p1 TRINITY_DN14900_c0_g1~~TRINITY_DN14900_c0_g1_i1.p1  ORF type:complete len:58 (+),score=12.99 TRINITY_DN14900_c0_g1_i1:240-413(+)
MIKVPQQIADSQLDADGFVVPLTFSQMVIIEVKAAKERMGPVDGAPRTIRIQKDLSS